MKMAFMNKSHKFFLMNILKQENVSIKSSSAGGLNHGKFSVSFVTIIRNNMLVIHFQCNPNREALKE